MARAILVTGAGGFAGSHLLEALVAEDVDMVAWSRPGERVPTLVRPRAARARIRWDEVDLLDPATVEAAGRAIRPDEVYHLAGAAHVGQSWAAVERTLAVNVLGTHHLLDTLRRHGAKPRLVVPSSAAVYGPAATPIDESMPLGPASPYALSKLAQERLALRAWREDGLPVIVARAFNHVGPRQSPDFAASSFARQLAAIEAGDAGPVLRVGNLDPRRDLTDVRDTVKAYVALARRGTPGRVYNVCSGRAVSVRELLDLMLARSSARIRLEQDPALLRPHDTPVVIGNAARIHAETGWEALVSLEQSVTDLLDDWRRRLATPGRS